LHGAHPTASQASFHGTASLAWVYSMPSHSQNPTDHI
jgi:hypothetical protein